MASPAMARPKLLICHECHQIITGGSIDDGSNDGEKHFHDGQRPYTCWDRWQEKNKVNPYL